MPAKKKPGKPKPLSLGPKPKTAAEAIKKHLLFYENMIEFNRGMFKQFKKPEYKKNAKKYIKLLRELRKKIQEKK